MCNLPHRAPPPEHRGRLIRQRLGDMQNDKPEQLNQVTLRLSPDEADALLHLLLCAPETDEVSEEMTAHLLRRIADAQRLFLCRGGVESGHEDRLS